MRALPQSLGFSPPVIRSLKKRMILRWMARSSRSRSLRALSRNLTFQVKSASYFIQGVSLLSASQASFREACPLTIFAIFSQSREKPLSGELRLAISGLGTQRFKVSLDL